MLGSLILVFALCTDTFVASLAYGANRVHVGWGKVALLNGICSGCLGLEMCIRDSVGENGVVLEYHAHIPLVGGDVVDDLAVNLDFAALNGIESYNHAQQSGFAASGRP